MECGGHGAGAARPGARRLAGLVLSRPRFKAIFTLWRWRPSSSYSALPPASRPGRVAGRLAAAARAGPPVCSADLARWPGAGLLPRPPWSRLRRMARPGCGLSIATRAAGAAGSPLETAVNVVLALAYPRQRCCYKTTCFARSMPGGRRRSRLACCSARRSSRRRAASARSGFALPGMAVPMVLCSPLRPYLPWRWAGRGKPAAAHVALAQPAPTAFLDPRSWRRRSPCWSFWSGRRGAHPVGTDRRYCRYRPACRALAGSSGPTGRLRLPSGCCLRCWRPARSPSSTRARATPALWRAPLSCCAIRPISAACPMGQCHAAPLRL